MNSIEEYQNLVQLLKKTLEFYADMRSYDGPMGNISLIDLDEHGSQARFALEQVKLLEAQNQKMLDDYDKIASGYEQLQSNDDIADIKELMKTYKILGDDKNI